MDFILPFSIKQFTLQVNIQDPIMLMGSCFAEEMCAKLIERQFNAVLNPHGILYNPISICTALSDYLQNKKYTQQDIFLQDDLWGSLNHHGKFSDIDANVCLDTINTQIATGHQQLKTAKWLILTFGSAYVYKKNDQVVANCHKLPANQFKKILLTKEEIVQACQLQMAALKEFNSHLNLIFTISPVRYIRDGVIENNRSKGILLDAVHTLVEQSKHSFYFPAYEIVMDELRDYRFFKEDLVHPNELAITYVWQKFIDTVCDNETKKFISEYEPVFKSLLHKSIQNQTKASLKFKQQLEEKKAALKLKYPFIKSFD